MLSWYLETPTPVFVPLLLKTPYSYLHMEAGNRCFDQRVPEESNRKIVDHTADINLTYSDIAREYLLAEGLRPDRIIKTGSPMYEVLMQYLPKIEASTILEKLNLEKGKFFVVSATGKRISPNFWENSLKQKPIRIL